MHAALANHGGLGQIGVYFGIVPGFWPEEGEIGVPDMLITSAGPQGFVELIRSCNELVCLNAWETVGQCAPCPGESLACDWGVVYGEIGFIAWGADGKELVRCVKCFNSPYDIPLPPCSSSSSSSSSSDTSSSSSSTSSDSSSSSSSTVVVVPPSSSSSSSSSSSGTSSSSSSSGCSCYVRLSASDLPSETGSILSVLAEAVFPDPACATGGTWVVSVGEQGSNISDPAFDVERCTTYAITATFTGANGVTCTEAISYKTECPSSSSSSSSTPLPPVESSSSSS